MRLPTGIPLFTLVLPVLFLSLNRVCSESPANGSPAKAAEPELEPSQPVAESVKPAPEKGAVEPVTTETEKEKVPPVKSVWASSSVEGDEASGSAKAAGKRNMRKGPETTVQEAVDATPPSEEDILGWKQREQALKSQIQAAATAGKDSEDALTREQILELVRERVEVSQKLQAVQNH